MGGVVGLGLCTYAGVYSGDDGCVGFEVRLVPWGVFWAFVLGGNLFSLVRRGTEG